MEQEFLRESNVLLSPALWSQGEREKAVGVRLQALVQATSDVFWVTDPHGNWRGDNLSWQKFTGQPIAEAHNTGWVEMVDREDHAALMERLAQVVKTRESDELSCLIWQARGCYSRVVVRFIPIVDEANQVQEVIFLGTCTLPCIKEDQQRLLSGQIGRLESALIQLAHDAIIIRNAKGRILYWNQGAVDLYGYSAEEALGRDVSILLNTHFPESLDAYKHELEHKEFWQGELTRTTHAGKQVIVESRQVLVRDQDERPLAILEVDRDVTVRRDVERQLNEYVQIATTAAEVGLWTWDIVEDKSMTTPQYMSVFGTTQPISYEQFRELIHPDDRERTDQAIKKALEDKDDYINEFRFMKPEHGLRWFLTYGRIIRDEQQNPIRMIGVLVDITNRKQYEENLQDANEKITSILESITDGFVFINSDWRYTYVNSQACRILNRTRDEMLGYGFWEVNHALPGTQVERYLRHAMEQRETTVFEMYWEQWKRWFAVRAYPAKGGITVYFTDITERKKIDEELRRSEAKFRRLVDANISAVAVGDISGHIPEANDAFLAMIGYTREELERGEVNWQKLTPLEEWPRDEQAVQVLQKTGVCPPYEKTFIHKKGRRIPLLVGAAAFEETRQKYIAFFLDLTPQKESEKQREQFLSLVSHELRTPLTVINGSLQLALRRFQRSLKEFEFSSPAAATRFEKVEEVLVQSLRQTRVLNRLIDDLLESARITADKLTLSLRPYNLATIVHETIEDMRFTAPERVIVLEMQSQEIPVMADAGRIGQVLVNFLSNAVKYSPAEEPILVGVTIEADEVRVRVQDRGPGLSEVAQKHVWERFYRADSVQDYSGKGVNMGLGLYISRAIIDQHGGCIGVESRLNEGSTFWFTLPLNKE